MWPAMDRSTLTGKEFDSCLMNDKMKKKSG